ncbi:hypothetical protein T265_15714, partial [Opisthorchis viverrini]
MYLKRLAYQNSRIFLETVCNANRICDHNNVNFITHTVHVITWLKNGYTPSSCENNGSSQRPLQCQQLQTNCGWIAIKSFALTKTPISLRHYTHSLTPDLELGILTMIPYKGEYAKLVSGTAGALRYPLDVDRYVRKPADFAQNTDFKFFIRSMFNG